MNLNKIKNCQLRKKKSENKTYQGPNGSINHCLALFALAAAVVVEVVLVLVLVVTVLVVVTTVVEEVKEVMVVVVVVTMPDGGMW